MNQNLNSFSFLIVLVHEIAHLATWNKFGGKVNPHGKEWKEEYRLHLQPFFELNIFPQDVHECLNRYTINPKASTCADASLIKVLKKYDEESEYVHLEDIPVNCIFKMKNGKTFIKGDKIRKRYKCSTPNGKKHYLISPVAEVVQTTLF